MEIKADFITTHELSKFMTDMGYEWSNEAQIYYYLDYGRLPSYTRKQAEHLYKESKFDITAYEEIDKLTDFIMEEYSHEPGRTGESESAVEVAIRLLKEKVG